MIERPCFEFDFPYEPGIPPLVVAVCGCTTGMRKRLPSGTETQSTKNLCFASILFGLTFRSNYMLKSLLW